MTTNKPDATELDVLLERALRPLREMVGLDGIKKVAEEIANNAKSDTSPAPVNTALQHMIITGNNGTGKRTSVIHLGKIYQAAGLLESGHVVEVDASSLILKNSALIEMVTQAKIDKAQGGILYLDKAHLLATDQENQDSAGINAIKALSDSIEKNPQGCVLVASGSPKGMEAFLDAVPKMRDQISRTVHYEDFTSEQLLQIFEKFAADDEYAIKGEAKAALKKNFNEIVDPKNKPEDFSNGHFVEEIFRKTTIKHSIRAQDGAAFDRKPSMTIEPEDLVI